MKKLLILSVCAAIAFVGCKKKEATVSTLHSYSKPTILIPGGTYYSMPVGGLLPEIVATAYDSFYHESCTVVYDQSKLDNTTPGVYIVTATAKNQYGMAATTKLFIAVTSVAPTVSLAGMYVQTATNDTVELMGLANGFYMTSDVAGNGASDTTYVIPAYFVQTSDVALTMPAQDTKFGTLSGSGGTVTMTATDTTYEYVIHNNFFAPTIRVFKKI